MRRPLLVLLFVFLCGWGPPLSAQSNSSNIVESPSIPPVAVGKAYVYKVTGGRDLRVYVLSPDPKLFPGQRPAFVSFHGGSWVSGSPDWFNDQTKYLVSRGMVGIEVEYRLLSPTDTKPPIECIEDAKSAFRWIRNHASELQIDPHKIGGAGGSAGGHLVAFAGLMTGFDDPSDDLTISARPDAMILFNPAIINGPGHWGYDRVGERYIEFSPFYHVSSKAPPAIIMVGTADVIIPQDAVMEFSRKMKVAGNDCQTWLFPNQPHGFFNKEPYKDITLLEVDAFLVHLGWLQGPATIASPALPKLEEPFHP